LRSSILFPVNPSLQWTAAQFWRQSKVIKGENYIVVNYKANSQVVRIWVLWEAHDQFFSPRLPNSNARTLNRKAADRNIEIIYEPKKKELWWLCLRDRAYVPMAGPLPGGIDVRGDAQNQWFSDYGEAVAELKRRLGVPGHLALLNEWGRNTMGYKHGKWIYSVAISFYVAFFLQNLWNWFAVPSLRVAALSYWQMFGLNLLFQTISGGPDTFPLLVQHASLPEVDKQRVEQTLTDEKVWTEVLMPLAIQTALRLTTALVVGWAIHAFLM
jgi:hypothetical protein